MKLTENQSAPLFTTHDVHGNEINLAHLRGKKTYLSFERNAGCPVCNLRTNQLLKQAEHFRAKHIIVIMVYESTVAKMREYLDGDRYPFHFIADPENTLYNMFGVERSLLKVMRSMFNGLMAKIGEGTKLFAKPMKQDGHMDRIPAEFLINEEGKIVVAHYGRFVGDHLATNFVLRSLSMPVATATVN
jgi:thioredoxin-dependent peroxiredoxin